MRQTSRVFPPIVGIASVPIVNLPLVALNVGDLTSLELVSDPELPALGSPGNRPAPRRLLNPAFEKFEP
ncbi:MAG: hypothetical protein JNM42_00925 [Propionivibrio sp.]|uniref:hypothetical protein n=1 Tax=Propionivibrio sp. TaxID=2212460 RepID=UPI001A3841AD|nr:hypothetical protein [Propionivibrio sp.]MBL8412984.1 hypothetical protein [Propionivibrio sp.]